MLNIQATLSTATPSHPDISGHASWLCPRAHLTTALLLFDGHTSIGDSRWDFCSQCNHSPNPPQYIRMQLQIHSQWLRNKQVTIHQYLALAHQAVSHDYLPDDPTTTYLGLPFRPGRADALREGTSQPAI